MRTNVTVYALANKDSEQLAVIGMKQLEGVIDSDKKLKKVISFKNLKRLTDYAVINGYNNIRKQILTAIF